MSSNEDSNLIGNVSLIDFSKLKNSDNQFNIGFQKNNINNSFYFSIDKLVSHNLIGSVKISLLNNNKLEIYNQNSFLFSQKDSSFNFLIAMNYLTNEYKIKRWFNLGVIFDLFKNHHLLDDNFFIGGYFDIDTKINTVNNFNYYLRMEKEFFQDISISFSTKYNTIHQGFNYNLELMVRV